MNQQQFQRDVLSTAAGDLEITFLGHGTLLFTFSGKQIHVDPFGRVADYAQLPKADLVLVTHDHFDHLDADALAKIRTPETEVIVAQACVGKVDNAMVMHNGETCEVAGIPIIAVPAYNILHKRDSGQPFHPKGAGNGYVLTFGDLRVYVAGDTENTPELKALEGIDVAFLPMNLPYTMSPEMAADAARALSPEILYPYHFGETDTAQLTRLLSDTDIEVRIRDLA